MNLGIDIGGTNIVAGLVNAKGRILKRTTFKAGKDILNTLFRAISDVKTRKIRGIGIGTPGPINLEKGSVGKMLNLPLKNLALRSMINKRFGLRTEIDNDANCFVLGEAVYGAGKGCKNVVGLTLGTGVGGGIVINQRIYHGRNNAGELGHTTINFDGPKAKCGNHGCLETYLGKKGVMKLARGLKAKEPLDVYRLALKGNKQALKVWKEYGTMLGIGIANMINSLDPDIFVVGGNVSKAWRFFSKSMMSEVKKRTLFEPCPVVKSKLGENAAVLGAAALVR